MKREDYIFASTRVRIFEKSLLPQSLLDRMIAAPDYASALKLLSESRYAAHFGKMKSQADYDQLLSMEREALYRNMKELDPEALTISLAELKYTVHNLKVSLKSILLQENLLDLALPYGQDLDEEIGQWLQKPGSNPGETELQKAVEQIRADYAQSGDGQRIDILADRFYFAEMRRLSEAMKSDYFLDYTRDSIDFYNVETLLRARAQARPMLFLADALVKGGHIKSSRLLDFYRLSLEDLYRYVNKSQAHDALKSALQKLTQDQNVLHFELARENHLLELAIEGNKILYGPEVLFAYLVTVETEMQNIRIILSALINGLPAAEIRERTRFVYA